MKQEKIESLWVQANAEACEKDPVAVFARLVELETLEMAKQKIELAQSEINWCTTSEWGEGWACGAQDALDGLLFSIRNLKETHDKE